MDIFHISLLVLLFAFICEYVDSSLGMGYGTTLTPLLLIMGYSPLQIVPAVLLSELITGLTAAYFHHRLKNSDFKIGAIDLRIALLMAACSVIGTVVAVLIALNLPAFYVKLYIGLLVTGMGIVILVMLNRTFRFSWKKIMALGFLASFNKGISGGGYGPLVTNGQILSGVRMKNAIGITSLAEGLTCLSGVLVYLLFTDHTIEWDLAPSLVLGALISVPFAAYTVKRVRGERLKLIVGIATLVLGCFTLGKLFF